MRNDGRLRDKNGKRLRSGDYILIDQILSGIPNFVLKVRWHSKLVGWVAEKLQGDPVPQRIRGLEHRITRIPKKDWKKHGL